MLCEDHLILPQKVAEECTLALAASQVLLLLINTWEQLSLSLAPKARADNISYLKVSANGGFIVK